MTEVSCQTDFLATTVTETVESLPAGESVCVFPASLEQNRYWLLDQLDPESTASNMAIAFRLDGSVSDETVRLCMDDLARRHEALRTRFRQVDGQLSQVISDTPEFSFAVEDLRAIRADAKEAELERLVKVHSEFHFRAESGPTFAALLIHVTEQEHCLAYTVPHILCDGWSNGILLREFGELYAARTEKRTPLLPELPFQYADFTVWQQEWLQSAEARTAIDVWKQEIGRRLSAVDLPLDHPRSAQQSGPGHIESLLLPAALQSRLNAFCRLHGCTKHQLLLAAFQALISRYTGQTEFLLGSTIANRTQPGMENVVGRFAHPQVVLADVTGDPTFADLLRRVQDWTTKIYAHQDLPFSRLMEEFQMDQAGATTQFLQVWFVYQKAFMQPLSAGPMKITPRPSVSGGVNFDMLVSVVERSEGPRVQLEYNTLLFEKSRVRRLLELYTALLEAVVADDQVRVSDLPMLRDGERALIESATVGEELPPREAVTVAEALLGSLRRHPNAVLVTAGELRMKAADLDKRSLQYAGAFQKLGLVRGQTAALRMEPRVESVIAAVALLRMGVAILAVPVGAALTEWERILERESATLAIGSRRFTQDLSRTGCSFEDLDATACTPERLQAPTEDDIAFVDPVGQAANVVSMCVSHGAAARRLRGTILTMGIGPEDSLLLSPALSSCDAWSDLMLALCSGAHLTLADRLSVEGLQEVLKRQGKCFALGYAWEWEQLGEQGWDGDWRLNSVYRGAPQTSWSPRRIEAHKGQRWSLIGSPAASGPFSAHHFSDEPRSAHTIHPVAGTRLLIHDLYGHETPVGAVGELFVMDVPGEGEALPQSTGYQATFTEQHKLELVGSLSRIVEVHGHNVRLGDIEELLLNHPAVMMAEVALVPAEDAQPRLVAYLVPKPGARVPHREVASYLKRTAPAHLAGAEVIWVDSLPRHIDGSADGTSLPQHATDDVAEGHAEVLPARDELEAKLVGIWEQVFNIRPIGVRTNFFTLGAYSLVIVRLFARINKALGISLPITTIFNAPTIEQLSNVVRGRDLYSSLVPVQPKGERTPFFMIHSYLLYGGLPSVLDTDQPFYGLRETEYDGELDLPARVAKYVEEIRAVQPKGPYFIGGWCAAGPLSVEAACQLSEAGEEIAAVVLFDSWRPGYAAEVNAAASSRQSNSLRDRWQRKTSYHRQKIRTLSAANKARYISSLITGRIRATRNRVYLRNWAVVRSLFAKFGLPLPDFMHNVSLMTFDSIRNYHPRPFAGKLILLRASDEPVLPGGEAACGWDGVGTKGTEVYWAPGDHESMFRGDNLLAVGDLVRKSLEPTRRTRNSGKVASSAV